MGNALKGTSICNMNGDLAVIYSDVINALADSMVLSVDAEVGNQVFAFEVC